MKGLSNMSDLYNRIESLCAERNLSITALCRIANCSRAALCDLKMGRKKGLSSSTLSKLATCLGVTVDYLLGNESPAPAHPAARGITEEDIKFALFGGDGEITDAMYQEVKEFAALIKLREDLKKTKE